MIRSVLIYGGILVASLAVAWLRFTAEPSVDLTDKVVLLQGDAEDITQITWKDEDEHAVIDKKTDAHGDYLWVTYTKTVEVEPTPDLPEPPEEEQGEDGEEPDAEEGEEEEAPAEEPEPEPEPEAEPETTEEVQTFKAGETGDELLTDFSPLVAIRKLEGVDDEKLESIGLAEPQGTMTVVRKGRTATFDVGGEAFGTRDIYLRDTDDGVVYIVDDEVLRPLRYARTRLPDRTLLSFERTELVKAVLSDAAGASLEVVQKNPADKESAAWVHASSPDEEAPQLETWMGKALMVKSTSTAAEGEEPEMLELKFTLTVTSEQGKSETLEVFQDGEGVWWGKSEHTRALVKLLRGVTSDLSDDVPGILSGEAAPEEDEDEAPAPGEQ